MAKLSKQSKVVLETTEIYRHAISKQLKALERELSDNLDNVSLDFIKGYARAVEEVSTGILNALAETIVTKIPDQQIENIKAPDCLIKAVQEKQWQDLLSKENYDKINIDSIVKNLQKKEGK